MFKCYTQVSKSLGKDVKKAIESLVVSFEEEDWGLNYTSCLLLNPGSYREFEDRFTAATKGKGSMEILDLKVCSEISEEII